MKELSKTYKFLRFIGLNYSKEEYGQVSLRDLLKKVWKTYRNAFLLKFLMNSVLFSPISSRKLRPWVLRKIGCKVGKDVFIGSQVYIDSGYSELIILENNVHVTARCLLLCHQRDLSNYFIGDDAAKLKYKKGLIHIKKGAMVGMNSVIMPGVTIGEGAIIGAFSLVTKDIPPWSIAVGRPAKVVKKISVSEN